MILLRTFPCLAILAFACLCQAPPAVTIDGGNGHTTTLSAADVSALPQQSIKAMEHGTAVTFDGVLLSDVLAKVEAPAGEKLRGKALAQYLLVEAADGYRAVFALAELDPAFSDKRVYLVTKREGKALSEKEGQFRIVAPDEKRPARWVRQVTALRVRAAQ
jgi:hypothetical protein